MIGSRLTVFVLALALALSVGMSTHLKAADKKSVPLAGILLSDGLRSSGYAHSRTIVETLNTNALAQLTLQPVSNSTDRTTLLVNHKADYCICDMESYFAQEGLLAFNSPEYGPQPLRLILSAASDFKLGLIIASDSKAKDIEGLAQKRIPWIRNADQLNANMTAFLAFAGLGWGDVVKLTYPGYEEAVAGFKRNQIDALLIEENLEAKIDIAEGKRPFIYADFSPKRRINWRRLQNVAPYLQPARPGRWNGVTHPYPVLIASDDQDTDQIYTLTKALSENLEAMSATLPGVESWHANWQNLEWVFPYHDGAIQYFTEIGIWTDAAQSHQSKLIDRQRRLRAAFDIYKSQNADAKTFKAGWQQERAASVSPKPAE